MGVAGQDLQVADAVAADAGGEGVAKRQCGQGRVPTGTAARDGQAIGIHVAALGEEGRRGDAIVDIDDAPAVVELLSILAPVAGAAAVVHVHDRDAPTREGLDLQVQGCRRVRCGSAVRQGHEWWALPVRPHELRVGRGVEERVRLASPAGRERDRLRAGDPGLVERQRAGPAQHARRRQGLWVQAHDHPGTPGRTGQDEDAGQPGTQSLEFGERRLDLADQLARIDVEQPVVPGASSDRDDRAVRQEAVRRAPEHPRGVGELGLHRGQWLEPGALDEAIQVPPAAAIRDEVEDPVGAPLGLGDGLIRAAGGEIGRAQRAVRGDLGDAQAGGLPGHGRVVPFEPRQPVAGRRDPRRGDEVDPGHQDPRRTLPIHGDVDDLVAGLAVARVVLAHREEAAPGRIEAKIGVPPRTWRRDRDRCVGARVDPIEPTVGHIGIHDHAARDGVRPTTVLVDPRPDRDGLRDDRLRGAVRADAHEHLATGFGWTGLQPIQIVAVDPWLVQADLVADQVVDPDRTPPGPVRGDGGFGHRLGQVPCCQEET